MAYIKLALLLITLISYPAYSAQYLAFNMPPTGYPPFMIHEANQEPEGIMYDVLKSIASKRDISIKIETSPRKRVDIDLRSGKLDATSRAKEWTIDPDGFVFSDIIIEVRDVIFSLKKSPVKFESIKDLRGKTVATHLGYSYPMLSEEFKTKKIIRSDSNSEASMLGKTFYSRTDAAIVNQSVGLWLIKHTPKWHGQFILSNKMVSGFSYRIMFTKKWTDFVTFFNQELANMKKTGKLKAIIKKYE